MRKFLETFRSKFLYTKAGHCTAVNHRTFHVLKADIIGASQIANKLGLSTEDKQIIMLAALLHDIGHGPFSHTFESIFYNRSIQHEMWTPEFLNEYKYNVNLHNHRHKGKP